MPAAPPETTTDRLAERREFVRRSMLRANRAIGVILALVLFLGMVLTFMIKRAEENQRRAEKAEAAGTEKVWKASLAHARAENLSTRAGRRDTALDAIRTAARIRPSIALRNEAIAALAQRDLVPERQWPLQPNSYGFQFDQRLEHYVTRYEPTVLSMYRMEDNAHVRDFPMPPTYPKGANVGDFQFSSTGKYLVIRYNGGGLTQWDPQTGKMLRTISDDPRAANYSWPLTFSADDRLMGLSLEGSEGSQFLYDLEMGEVRTLPAFPEKLRYRGDASAVRLSPRGDALAGFEGSTIHVFDAVTGETRATLAAPSRVDTLTWDREGKRLSFSYDNKTLATWEPPGASFVQMGGHILLPWIQDFSHDGTSMMTSGQDGVTRLWDLAAARTVSEIKGIQAGWMSGDGKRFAGGVPGQSVGVWRIEQPAAMTVLQGAWTSRATVWRMDLSQDGRFAVLTPPGWASDFGYEVHDLERGGSVRVPTRTHVQAGFRPGHAQLWTTGKEAITLRPLPRDRLPEAAAMEANAETVPLPAGMVAIGASFSADGRHAVVSGSKRELLVVDLTAPAHPVPLAPAFRPSGSAPGPASPTGGGMS